MFANIKYSHAYSWQTKAFRSPGVLVLGDFGIFCLFLPRASREVKKAENASLVRLSKGVRLREQQPS